VLDYLLALGLTMGVEVPLAWLLGLKRKSAVLAMVMVNLATHPLLHFVLLVILTAKGWTVAPPYIVIVLECCVVAAEWGLLSYALGRPGRMLLVSIVTNAASYTAGLLLLH
jgi:hypothetical protein